ncbi:unnamed protein product [Linum trigynum]|uniref:Uncharacterized protein n=1 Tax=Linum trigynum TaxID=586398 RepID=A0AAV2GR52_9ROSI
MSALTSYILLQTSLKLARLARAAVPACRAGLRKNPKPIPRRAWPRALPASLGCRPLASAPSLDRLFPQSLELCQTGSTLRLLMPFKIPSLRSTTNAHRENTFQLRLL